MTKSKKKEWITAEELMAQLEADPEYIARSKKHDEEFRKHWDAIDAELVPLEDELRASGCPSLSSMFSQTRPPNLEPAIPILLTHLQKNYPHDARMRIAWALQKPEVKAHWNVLTTLYRNERDEEVKGQLACNISVIADAGLLSEVIALIRDTNQGPSRAALVYTLEKTKDPRGRAVMEELANDPDLAEQIAASLKHLDRLKIRQAQRQARKNPTRH